MRLNCLVPIRVIELLGLSFRDCQCRPIFARLDSGDLNVLADVVTDLFQRGKAAGRSLFVLDEVSVESGSFSESIFRTKRVRTMTGTRSLNGSSYPVEYIPHLFR
ncbi:MAG: hypothetical protein JWM11_6774 [Planctomycetaceae bacterium]|nr:hypothetical protein [Planctomycetaceae bacterium]